MALRYIISDSQDRPLARALLQSPPDAPVWEFLVLDKGVKAVLEHEVLKLIGMDANAPAMVGKLLNQRGDRIVLEPISSLGEDIRRNLRVAARFDSFIYPVTGQWKGRCAVEGHDLSCGGVAFFSPRALANGEVVEIVIPLVEPPLLLKAMVIRPRPSNSEVQLYAAKYVDLSNKEEALVREAVFGRQIKNRKKQESTPYVNTD